MTKRHNAKTGPWRCPGCGAAIGRIISGAVLLGGGVVLDDRADPVTLCLQCGERVTWRGAFTLYPPPVSGPPNGNRPGTYFERP